MRDAMTNWKQLVESAGYLDLGMPDEASADLDRLPPEWTAKIEVTILRAGIYSEAEDWQRKGDHFTWRFSLKMGREVKMAPLGPEKIIKKPKVLLDSIP